MKDAQSSQAFASLNLLNEMSMFYFPWLGESITTGHISWCCSRGKQANGSKVWVLNTQGKSKGSVVQPKGKQASSKSWKRPRSSEFGSSTMWVPPA